VLQLSVVLFFLNAQNSWFSNGSTVVKMHSSEFDICQVI